MNYAVFANHDLSLGQTWAQTIERCVQRFDPLCWRGRLLWLHCRNGSSFRLPPPKVLDGLVAAAELLRAAGCALGFYTGGSILDPADTASSMSVLRLAGVSRYAIDASAKAPAGTTEHHDLTLAQKAWAMEPCIEARMRRLGSEHQRGWSVVCQDHLVPRTFADRLVYLPPRGVVRRGGKHYTLLVRDSRGDPWGPGECAARAQQLIRSPYETPVLPLWELTEIERAQLTGVNP